MDRTFTTEFDLRSYQAVRDEGVPWIVREERGILAVSGSEAVQFLNGLITNDVEKLEDGRSMLAAFPNAKGRMMAVVRVEREKERFLFDTENATYESVLANLQRFTLAGDFRVEDLTGLEEVLSVRGVKSEQVTGIVLPEGFPGPDASVKTSLGKTLVSVLAPIRGTGFDLRLSKELASSLTADMAAKGAIHADGALAETLRIESGVPGFGMDFDAETVVPEIGLAEMISYEKGCYIGQEVIARIHFRGKVAKELKGVIFEAPEALVSRGDELHSKDGRSAGVITSKCYSPKMKKHIAMAYIRNAYLKPGTELLLGLQKCRVCDLPFIP